MSDIEESLQKITAGLQAETTGDHNLPREAAFRKLRAHVGGVLFDAHRALQPANGSWQEQDDRILDIVRAWLENVRDRR